MNTQSGVTLIELVLVIIIISVASVPLFSMFSQASSSLLTNETLQTSVQLAQERAEFVLSRRRELGYNGAVPELAVGSITENLAGNYTGYVRQTDITQPLVPPGGCPVGALCKQVVVSINHGGPVLARIEFLLVDY